MRGSRFTRSSCARGPILTLSLSVSCYRERWRIRNGRRRTRAGKENRTETARWEAPKGRTPPTAWSDQETRTTHSGIYFILWRSESCSGFFLNPVWFIVSESLPLFSLRCPQTSISVTSDLSTRSSASLNEEQFEDYGEGEEPDYIPSSPCPDDETRTNGYSDLGSSVPSRWLSVRKLTSCVISPHIL